MTTSQLPTSRIWCAACRTTATLRPLEVEENRVRNVGKGAEPYVGGGASQRPRERLNAVPAILLER